MRTTFALCLLILTVCLQGINLSDGTRTIAITPDSLAKLPQSEVKTQREKRGEIKTETWSGVSMPVLLGRYGIDPASELRIVSDDNYQALLTSEQTAGAILALFHNGEVLPPEKIRLVNPQIRDMFWIQNPILIEVQKKPRALECRQLLLLNRLLDNMAVRPDLPPFADMQGWYFRDLASQVVSEPKGVWFVWGRDGVCQVLDYDTYLQNAAIIRTDDLLDLKSPDMPAGMWIKDLAVLQKDETVLVLAPRFADLNDVSTLLGWKNLPGKVVTLPDLTPVSNPPAFSDPWWNNQRGIRW